MQCYSQSVGHMKRCDATVFHKMCNVTHILLVIQKNAMGLAFTNVQYHSLPISHMKRYDETGFHKMCDVTHFLSWGKNTLNNVSEIFAILLTFCSPYANF